MSEASHPEFCASPVWLALNQRGGRVEMQSESTEKPLELLSQGGGTVGGSWAREGGIWLVSEEGPVSRAGAW